MHVSDNRYSRIISIISKANTSGDNKEESSQSKANKQTKSIRRGRSSSLKPKLWSIKAKRNELRFRKKKNSENREKNGMQTRRDDDDYT